MPNERTAALVNRINNVPMRPAAAIVAHGRRARVRPVMPRRGTVARPTRATRYALNGLGQAAPAETWRMMTPGTQEWKIQQQRMDSTVLEVFGLIGLRSGVDWQYATRPDVSEVQIAFNETGVRKIAAYATALGNLSQNYATLSEQARLAATQIPEGWVDWLTGRGEAAKLREASDKLMSSSLLAMDAANDLAATMAQAHRPLGVIPAAAAGAWVAGALIANWLRGFLTRYAWHVAATVVGTAWVFREDIVRFFRDPADRFKKMEQEAIEKLKDQSLPPELKEIYKNLHGNSVKARFRFEVERSKEDGISWITIALVLGGGYAAYRGVKYLTGMSFDFDFKLEPSDMPQMVVFPFKEQIKSKSGKSFREVLGWADRPWIP